MKQLKHIIIPPGDGLEKEYDIRGAEEKPLVFCVRDSEDELLYLPLSKEEGKHCVEIEEETISAIGKGEYIYSIRIQEKPKRTIAQGKLTIE